MNERNAMSEPQPQDDLLNQPVATEDLSAELKQSKRSMSKLTLGLLAALVVVAAFFGGIATHAAIADDTTPQAAGPGGGRQFNFRGTVGTVEKVEGTDIYVKTPDGRTVKVSTSDATKVRVNKEGALSDLQQGQSVVVLGSAGSDGTVAAQTITQTPARVGNN
jgi:cytochrome c-type biogenesis protein CcmE